MIVGYNNNMVKILGEAQKFVGDVLKINRGYQVKKMCPNRLLVTKLKINKGYQAKVF